MTAGVAVMERSGNVVFLGRIATHEELDRPRQRAIKLLREMLPLDSVLYAVPRTGADAGWIVCDLYLIDGPEVLCVTADVATALDCHDPGREPGVRLRRSPAGDTLAIAIEGRLSMLLFGQSDRLIYRIIG